MPPVKHSKNSGEIFKPFHLPLWRNSCSWPWRCMGTIFLLHFLHAFCHRAVKDSFSNLPPAFMVSFSLFLQKIRYSSKLMQQKCDTPPGPRHSSIFLEFYTFMETIRMWKGIQTTNLLLSSQFSFFFSQLNILKVCVYVCFTSFLVKGIFHYLFF